MADPAAPPSPEAKLKERLELAGKITAAILAGLYGIGLLIVNIHLQNFGISDFSVVEARYLLTGLIFLAFVCGPLAIVAVPWLLARHRPRPARRSVLELAISVLLAAGFYAGLAMAVDPSTVGGAESGPDWPWRLYFAPQVFRGHEVRWGTVVGLFLGIYLPILLWVNRQRLSRRFAGDVLALMLAVWLTLGLGLTGARFANLHYPLIRASFGGGSFGELAVVVEKDVCAALSLPIVADQCVLADAQLVHESKDACYLKLGGEVIRVQQDAIVMMKKTVQ